MMPYSEIRIFDGVPEYKRTDVEACGHPGLWGVQKYLVIDDVEMELVGMWRHEDNFDCHARFRKKPRPTHRYSRVERFETMLGHLMGFGSVSDEIIQLVADELQVWDEYVWEGIEKVLSDNGKTSYVNRIPVIMEKLGFRQVVVGKFDVGEIEHEFERISRKFDASGMDRKYFPKLRYVGLRMLVDYGAKFNYMIPLVKTDCKIKPLDFIYNKLRS